MRLTDVSLTGCYTARNKGLKRGGKTTPLGCTHKCTRKCTYKCIGKCTRECICKCTCNCNVKCTIEKCLKNSEKGRKPTICGLLPFFDFECTCMCNRMCTL